ncbi:hypothetical protein DES53_11539 [Roseimicrobium gellanilyticum]|uniref:Uncharacterized protein n=1 Tax=Roseimicrobium gellanilyticum TaxID=748857 RepID=A0A366H4R4_9BACT|nr:hypothetical protein [Roseimicrobium gellanilyticum]RBP36898.1 hypothetical protein DES53_11539 [Roseimicrobium gellanilyticum]
MKKACTTIARRVTQSPTSNFARDHQVPVVRVAVCLHASAKAYRVVGVIEVGSVWLVPQGIALRADPEWSVAKRAQIRRLQATLPAPGTLQIVILRRIKRYLCEETRLPSPLLPAILNLKFQI